MTRADGGGAAMRERQQAGRAEKLQAEVHSLTDVLLTGMQQSGIVGM